MKGAMIEERILFGTILIIIIGVFIYCPASMKKYLKKWLIASLVMPLLVALFQSKFGGLALILWPGSVVLMSLGASERPWPDVIHVWGAGITLNLGLYFILGIVSYFIAHSLRKRSEYKKHNK